MHVQRNQIISNSAGTEDRAGIGSWPEELKQIVSALIDLAVRVTTTNSRALVLNEILTADELAARFKVPLSTIEELARRGKLPGAFRVGKHWRFDLDRLRAALPDAGDEPLDKS